MLRITKRIITGFALLAALVAPVWVGTSVAVADEIGDCVSNGASLDNLNIDPNKKCVPDSKQTDAATNLTKVVKLVVNVLSVLVGVVAVIMIIWGGLKYITSGGDANNVKTAKNTILYALIGLVIVALAQFIVKFVLTKATDVGNG